MPRLTLHERFWSKVDRRGPDECWEWLAGRTNGGYGLFGLNRAGTTAHRVAYELVVGPIPEGLEIDHLCRNRGCVNPSHLEPVTRRVNQLRGFGVGALNARKTHCPRGHEYSPENTYTSAAGGRTCRMCRRMLENARYQHVPPVTHCIRGHEFTPDNTYTHRGKRQCKECGRERTRAWQARRKTSH